MGVLTRAVIATASVWAALGWAGDASAACQLRKVADWPARVEHGATVIDGAINGKPVRFVVGLGAPKSQLYSKGAERLGLKIGSPVFRGEVTGYGVGGAQNMGSARINELTLGGASTKNFDMLVWPGGSNDPNAPVGVIGQDFFTTFDIELDLAHGAVRLFKPDGCTGDQVVYWPEAYAVVDGGHSRVDLNVALNGSPLYARIAPGFGRSTVTREAARRAGIAPGALPEVVPSLPGLDVRPVPMKAASFSSFSVGTESIANVKLPVGDLYGADTVDVTGSRIQRQVNQPEMLLGSDFLQSHRIYIAVSQDKIYISYIGGPVFAADASAPPPPP
jgi:hypothetical protein